MKYFPAFNDAATTRSSRDDDDPLCASVRQKAPGVLPFIRQVSLDNSSCESSLGGNPWLRSGCSWIPGWSVTVCVGLAPRNLLRRSGIRVVTIFWPFSVELDCFWSIAEGELTLWVCAEFSSTMTSWWQNLAVIFGCNTKFVWCTQNNTILSNIKIPSRSEPSKSNEFSITAVLPTY